MARSLRVKRLGLALIVIGMFIVIGTNVYRQSRAQQSQPPNPRVVDLKSADGTLLKATYFAAGKPGPGVILFHQNNRTRTSWDDVARQLAAAGMNTLTLDSRGHGESGGTREYAESADNARRSRASEAAIDRGAAKGPPRAVVARSQRRHYWQRSVARGPDQGGR